MPIIQSLYGVPISGISFPMVTGSGTYATGYDPAQLSGVLSKNGGAWAALGTRFSSIPGAGVYTLASTSSTEMQCYTWAIMITANSGCLPQTILGQCVSGYALVSDVNTANSGLATLTSVSGMAGILLQTSGLIVQCSAIYGTTSGLATLLSVSGATGILANTSTIIGNTSNILSNLSSIIAGVSTPVTLAAGQTVYASGLSPILTAVSNIPSADVTNISSMLLSTQASMSGFAHSVDASGNNNLLAAVSGVVSGVAGIATTDSLTIASGTLAEDIRRLRWFAWENLVVDKTFTPNRLYLKTDGTNYSSYYQLTDDTNYTKRTRGG
jgi:hypothetical protein